MKANKILDQLEVLFPEAECELNYTSVFELSIAVILSAQTTDKAVNKITPQLFEKYPTAKELANADLKEVEGYLRRLGLYHNKAKNIILFSKQIEEKYDGVVPNNFLELTQLAGVGRKTANVILSEYYKVPAIAVDTHVERVSKRLGLAAETDSVLEVEKKLQKAIPKKRWSKAHHLFIFFGRYHCKAKNPLCDTCPFTKSCVYYKQQKKNSK